MPASTKAMGAVAVIVMLVVGVMQTIGAAQRGRVVAPLVGVWRQSELTTTGLDGRTRVNPHPEPGLLIFTARYYSFNAVTSDGPRPALPVPLTAATDKQLADAFGPFHAVVGTYEIEGNRIMLTRIAAKNPNSMRTGNSEFDTFRLEGTDTLWLTEQRQNPVTWRLTRVE